MDEESVPERVDRLDSLNTVELAEVGDGRLGERDYDAAKLEFAFGATAEGLDTTLERGMDVVVGELDAEHRDLIVERIVAYPADGVREIHTWRSPLGGKTTAVD